MPLPPPPQPKKKGEGEGFPWELFLFAAVIVVPLLGYNYLLNIEAEKQETDRPYGAYPMEDIESMILGYEAEIADLEKQLGRVKSGRDGPKDVLMLDDQIDEFQRMAGQTRKQKEASLRLGQAEVTLKDLRKEKKLRTDDPYNINLHMDRLFDFEEFRRKH